MTETKKLGGFSLFTLWFGASISLAEIMTGSLLAPLGIKTGILVILLGHLIGTLILSLTGIIGFKEKKPALVSSRMSLGRYGSYIISLFNIIQLTGWTAIMLIQCSRAMQSMTDKLFGFNNLTTLIVITGILVAIWAFNNANGISVINNLAVMLLLVLCLLMLNTILSGGSIKPIHDTISIGLALELSIIMPLSWVPLISDYTMSGKTFTGSFFGSFAGYFLGSSFMYIMGLLFSLYSGSSDPVVLLSSLNMGVAALLILILSTVTTTFLDVYSAVMSTLNLSSKLSRRKLIILFASLGTLLAIFFPMENFENFLYMIGSLFAPAFSVILADYFIYKQDHSLSLFNIPGIIAMISGIAAYYVFLSKDLVIGTTIPAMMFTVLAYLIIRWLLRATQNIYSTRIEGEKQNAQ
ncbi:MAG: putative hydroxymethylpyrimidine transporter CytX [Bacillota bacterium]|nr:putative hydroxymethylpyrimidine transporter CytX [Bacillota bacterium]